MARPFLKWAGGKTQLLEQIQSRLPPDISECTTYLEPFLGGGAVLFHLLDSQEFEYVRVSDLNEDLTLCYKMLQSDAELVAEILQEMSDCYPSSKDDRKEAYYEVRERWNSSIGSSESMGLEQKAKRAAQTIFLNKTCFNGLFRVNSDGLFNVPMGDYVKPSFPSKQDLLEVQAALKGVVVQTSGFQSCREYANDRSFIYLDPPYRPISKTSGFVSYSKGDFDDADQRELAKMFRKLDETGARILLSNSDPKSTDPGDDFFDDLYEGFTVERILSRRSINSLGSGRGKISEIMVRNY